jgi:hypothetical protein
MISPSSTYCTEDIRSKRDHPSTRDLFFSFAYKILKTNTNQSIHDWTNDELEKTFLPNFTKLLTTLLSVS